MPWVPELQVIAIEAARARAKREGWSAAGRTVRTALDDFDGWKSTARRNAEVAKRNGKLEDAATFRSDARHWQAKRAELWGLVTRHPSLLDARYDLALDVLFGRAKAPGREPGEDDGEAPATPHWAETEAAP